MNRNSISEDNLGKVSGGSVEKVERIKEATNGFENDHLVLKKDGKVLGHFANTEEGIAAMNVQAAKFGVSTVTDLMPKSDGTYDLGKKVGEKSG